MTVSSPIADYGVGIVLNALADSILLLWVFSCAGSHGMRLPMSSWAGFLVAILILLSGGQNCIVDATLWNFFTNHRRWRIGVRCLWACYCLAGVINSIVQMWFLLRLWKITRKRVAFLLPLALLWGGVLISNFYNIAEIEYALHTLHHYENPRGYIPEPSLAANPSFSFWVTGSLVLDSLIAAIFIYKFRPSGAEHGILDRVKEWGKDLLCETPGLPALSFLFANVLSYMGCRILAMTCVLISSKLHVIAFLRSLNSRNYFSQLRNKEKKTPELEAGCRNSSGSGQEAWQSVSSSDIDLTMEANLTPLHAGTSHAILELS